MDIKLILICLLLTGCNSYIKPTHYKNDMKVVWVRTDEPDKLCREWHPKAGEDKILGCVHIDYDTCYIASPQIQYQDDDHTMTLGHELAHCFIGNYHKQ